MQETVEIRGVICRKAGGNATAQATCKQLPVQARQGAWLTHFDAAGAAAGATATRTAQLFGATLSRILHAAVVLEGHHAAPQSRRGQPADGLRGGGALALSGAHEATHKPIKGPPSAITHPAGPSRERQARRPTCCALHPS